MKDIFFAPILKVDSGNKHPLQYKAGPYVLTMHRQQFQRLVILHLNIKGFTISKMSIQGLVLRKSRMLVENYNSGVYYAQGWACAETARM